MQIKKNNTLLFVLLGHLAFIPQHASAMGMMGGMGSTTTTTSSVIDPPMGAAYKDPQRITNLAATRGLVQVNLEAKIAPVNINGVTANLMTYNGQFPGPTIKVKKGDRLKIHFTNSLPYTGTNMMGDGNDFTNLHTHGLHVSPEGNSDNVMLSLMNKQVNDYEYDLSKQPGGSFNWYHPHRHGNVADQVWKGLAGALEVADDTTLLANYETHIMMLKDISLSGSSPAAHSSSDWMSGKEGDIVMVNGQVNPVLNMKPGQVQRWKIVNASNARFYKLSLNNHNLQVIGTDGGLLNKPYPLGSILMSPGERLDILVKASATPGSYKLLSLPYSRSMGMMMSSGSSQQITLLTVKVSGAAYNDTIPAAINPNVVRLSVPVGTPTRKITLSMGMMGMMMGGGMGMATINGIAYSHDSAYTAASTLGRYEIWEVSNMSMMDHPFHHHVNSAQVLSISGGDSGYASFYTSAPAWKDTVIVPKGGTVRLLMPVFDFPGLTVFHCHILEHEEMGMMGLWDIR